MKVSGKSARHTPSSFHDREAISRLEVILSSHRLVAPDLKKDDTWPNHDGYLEVLDINGHVRGTIVAQVKTLAKQRINKKISYRFKDDKFLSFCSEIRENPILFIGVDRKNNVAYWLEVTPQAVRKMRSLTIYFPVENVISEDNNNYHDAWLKLCEIRKDRIRKIEERKKESVIPQKSVPIKKVSKKSISQARQRIKVLFIDINLKYKYYYAFIDLLEPFYLDNKEKEQRKKLRELFDITLAEEHKFIKDMAEEGLVKIVGDLCMTNDQNKAVELQKEIIEKGAIDIETILKLFA